MWYRSVLVCCCCFLLTQISGYNLQDHTVVLIFHNVCRLWWRWWRCVCVCAWTGTGDVVTVLRYTQGRVSRTLSSLLPQLTLVLQTELSDRNIITPSVSILLSGYSEAWGWPLYCNYCNERKVNRSVTAWLCPAVQRVEWRQLYSVHLHTVPASPPSDSLTPILTYITTVRQSYIPTCIINLNRPN